MMLVEARDKMVDEVNPDPLPWDECHWRVPVMSDSTQAHLCL
jgi:hypothetical protein